MKWWLKRRYNYDVFLLRFPFRGEILSRNVGKCSLHIISAEQKLFHAMTANGIEAFLSVLQNSSCTSANENCRSRSWIPLQVHRCCNSLWWWIIANALALNIMQMMMYFFSSVRTLFVAWPARFDSFENSPQLNWIISRKFPNQPKEKTENLLFYSENIFGEKGRKVGKKAAKKNIAEDTAKHGVGDKK